MAGTPGGADGMVRAAGGVVWREGPGGGMEVLVIHRSRYDDWSWPKGKADSGEAAVDTARREVEEETGLRPELGAELSPVTYRDHRGRDKTVRYWVMKVPAGDSTPFTPNDEVDELKWCAPDAARALLSYLRDVALIDELEAAVGCR